MTTLKNHGHIGTWKFEYSRVPGANTVVYYPFKSDLNDYSGNGHNLTGYNGAKITDGVLDLTDSNSYLQATISTLPQGSHARTNMCWVKWNDLGYRVAYTYGGNSNYKGDIFWKNNPISWGSYGYNIESSITATTGTWYHLAVTTSGNSEKFYINGTLVGSKSYSLNTTGTTLYVGKERGSNGYLNGYISDLIIEDRTLSADDISEYYNKTKGKYGL